MNYINVFKYITIFTITVFQQAFADPDFRILAPQIICPKHDNMSNENPDQSIITIKSKSGTNLDLMWMVRWVPLSSPSQRLTLNLWKATRDLEKKLNNHISTDLEYIINNDELPSGVTYIFNVTATSTDEASTKSFNIHYEGGSQTIKDIQSQADKFSVTLLGGQTLYADLEYILVAKVTTCTNTQDYYFSWTVSSTTSDHVVNVSYITGSRLEIPAYSLKPGASYEANCEMRTDSTDDIITSISLPFSVLHRRLQVYLNVDELTVPSNYAFTIEALVIYMDLKYYQINFEWQCNSKGKVCDFFENSNERIYNFSHGIPDEGEYEILVTVTVLEEVAKANATIKASNTLLPVLQIQSINRVVNENFEVYLVGEASNLAPSCGLTWYFASEECSETADSVNDTWNGCLVWKHEDKISDTITLYSIEENFLDELVDFTNDTHTRIVEAKMSAKTGRARLVAECNCSVTFECESQGISYGDLYIQLNESPKIYNFTVSPQSGSSDAVFRAHASAADADKPLRFTFYCAIQNETLLLASYLDHYAVVTPLPFIDGGTDIWVEVCDSLGACSRSESQTVKVHPSETDIEKLINKTRAHLRRCEVIELTVVAASTVIILTNSQRWEQLTIFTRSLLETLPVLRSRCALSEDRYSVVTSRLAAAGFDTAALSDKN